jgi:LCP family protein required for cell wall assembly
LVVLLLLAGIGGYFYVWSELNSIPRMKVTGLTPPQSGQPTDILMVGSDTRACETTAAQARAFGSKATQIGQRADTIMIARFLPGGNVEMLSIPRDTWVPISGTTISAKINSSFNTGPSGLVATIEKNFHIPINHVMQVNFCGFPGMVNALGGLYMDFPDPVRDAYTGLNVTHTGCQNVDGSEALALVRSRHLYYFAHGAWNYDGMSDFSRIQRQQAFFHALLSRVHSVIPDVFRLTSFVGAMVKGLRVDASFASNTMIGLGWSYHSLGQKNLHTSVLPTTEAVIQGQDALLPAPSQDHTVISAFLAGDTSKFQSALGQTQGRVGLTASSVITGNFAEPWNPYPC